jgi:hypothetical protein
MQLWNKLYNTIWLPFFSCVLIPRWMGRYAGPPMISIMMRRRFAGIVPGSVFVLIGSSTLAIAALRYRQKGDS